MSYDSWKCTDVAMERASDAEDALDKYEAQVWVQVVDIYGDRANHIPGAIMECHRDQLFDWMNDDVPAQDAAEIILESRSTTDILVKALERSDKNIKTHAELTVAYEQAQGALSNASADMIRVLDELEEWEKKEKESQ